MPVDKSVDIPKPDVGHREFIPGLDHAPFPQTMPESPVEVFDAIMSAAKAALSLKYLRESRTQQNRSYNSRIDEFFCSIPCLRQRGRGNRGHREGPSQVSHSASGTNT